MAPGAGAGEQVWCPGQSLRERNFRPGHPAADRIGRGIGFRPLNRRRGPPLTVGFGRGGGDTRSGAGHRGAPPRVAPSACWYQGRRGLAGVRRLHHRPPISTSRRAPLASDGWLELRRRRELMPPINKTLRSSRDRSALNSYTLVKVGYRLRHQSASANAQCANAGASAVAIFSGAWPGFTVASRRLFDPREPLRGSRGNNPPAKNPGMGFCALALGRHRVHLRVVNFATGLSPGHRRPFPVVTLMPVLHSRAGHI